MLLNFMNVYFDIRPSDFRNLRSSIAAIARRVFVCFVAMFSRHPELLFAFVPTVCQALLEVI